MPDPKNDEEAKFNETLKRMLKAPPKPHKPKPSVPAKRRDAKPKKS